MNILERLSYAGCRVVEVELSKDKKTVQLSEDCDLYFSEHLNKKDFGLLIDELTAIHQTMIEDK